MFLPDFPGRPAGGPEPFQRLLVVQRVHRLPETLVPERGELPVFGQSLHGPALPHGLVVVDEVEDGTFEDEKAAVDPGPVAAGLFLEAGYAVIAGVQGERTETPGRLHRRHRRAQAVRLVELD